MSHNISLDREQFISSFLSPINKLTDKCIVELDGNTATAIVSDESRVMFLHSVCNLKHTIAEPTTLNIGNVPKLCQAIDCINEDEIDFEVHHNNLKYSSPSIKFVYHLLDDNIISKNQINIDNVNSLNIDTSFNLSKQSLSTILKNSSFTSDSSKIYFFTKDGEVYCELNDKTMPNLDSIEMKVCDEFAGDPLKTELVLRLDWFRCFSGIPFDQINIRVNDQRKIVTFNITTPSAKLQYIVSGLSK